MNNKNNLNDIALAWKRLQSAPENTAEYSECEWVLHEFGVLIALEPIQAWHVVESIYEANRSDAWITENLGAGPVETMLRTHGQTVLPLVSLYISENEEFISVIKHVWNHSLPPEIGSRLAEIIKSSEV
ncbi:DUF6869 domain-containing protein [Xanthomonas bundabergensis]|uniref:DUF6869 domain-containing protein n=1 Tax=Xanthomonas bundabergensis TaxID=3160842 RepID=UPI003517AE3C